MDPLFAPDDHVVPPPVHTPPAQLPFPFIRSADAVEEIIGAGSDKIAIAKAIEAIAASIDFMINSLPSYPRSLRAGHAMIVQLAPNCARQMGPARVRQHPLRGRASCTFNRRCDCQNEASFDEGRED